MSIMAGIEVAIPLVDRQPSFPLIERYPDPQQLRERMIEDLLPISCDTCSPTRAQEAIGLARRAGHMSVAQVVVAIESSQPCDHAD